MTNRVTALPFASGPSLTRYRVYCGMARRPREHWTAERVKTLRRALALTQRDFAQELGVRQQTISEWETGVYAPRGASARLLDVVAEQAGIPYGEPPADSPQPDEGGA